MRFGYIISPERGDTDLRLSRLADALVARGVAVVAAVQTNTDCADRDGCDMDLRLVPGGEVFRISQYLGPASRGCRLDPAALEAAVATLTPRLAGAQILILNKFGKHEAEGRGFRDLIGQALGQGVPVIVGVNAKNSAAFAAFAGGLAQQIPGADDALIDWALGGVPA